MKEIVKMKFGSYLYGTQTPESDTDYRGVFIPKLSDVLYGDFKDVELDKPKKESGVKNTKDDVDLTLYSVQKFFKLLEKGDTGAYEMLFAPESAIVFKTKEWDSIQNMRDHLISKNIKNFIGYCRTQADKYGIRGSRLSAIKFAFNLFDSYDDSIKLSKCGIVDSLKEYSETNSAIKVTNEYVEICNRKFPYTIDCGYAKDICDRIAKSYGDRAKKAESNEGIDWKAIHHALRVCYQAEELLSTGKLTFPYTGERLDILMKVKKGEIPWLEIKPILEQKMNDLDRAEASSTLPECVDRLVIDLLLRNFYIWGGE